MKSISTFLRYWPVAAVSALALVLVGAVDEAVAGGKTTKDAANKRAERGRYLVAIAGCNDCHTPAFMQGNTNVPESEWLQGSQIGFMGPWGTSYPWNLRTMVQRMSEKEWVGFVQSYKALPPMPTESIKSMTEADLGAIYTFIKSLGSAGTEAPVGIAPGTLPTTPYVDFTPKVPGISTK